MVNLSLVHIDALSVEACARKTPGGDLFVVCTCGGTKEPAVENQVYLFRSKDGGMTFSAKQRITEGDGVAHYATSVVVRQGKIHVFVSEHNGKFIDWRNYIYTSSDDGNSWSRRALAVLPQFAFVRDACVLSDGSLMLPYHYYPVTEEQNRALKKRGGLIAEAPVPHIELGVLTADDALEHFERRAAFLQSREKIANRHNYTWSWSENTIAEAEPGHLVMLFRICFTGKLWRSDSFDFGKTWSEPRATDIPNPSNKPQLLKTERGELVLVNTPSAFSEGWHLNPRFPLEVWVSGDALNSFRKKIRVSDFPGGYSYADGFIDEDGRLKLAFEFNRHDIYFADIALEDD